MRLRSKVQSRDHAISCNRSRRHRKRCCCLIMTERSRRSTPSVTGPTHIPESTIRCCKRSCAMAGREWCIVSGRDAADMCCPSQCSPPSRSLGRPWSAASERRWEHGNAAALMSERSKGLSDADRWLRLSATAAYRGIQGGQHCRPLARIERQRARMISGRAFWLGWGLIAERMGSTCWSSMVESRCARPARIKGMQFVCLLNEIGPDAPVAYLGDDNTDESAFRVMQGRGISVLVRPQRRRTAAQVWMRPPDELLDFLGLWLKACTGESTSNNSAAATVNG